MKRYEVMLELLLECLILVFQILLCIYILPKTLGYLWPFVIGWIIALIAGPLTSSLQKRLKLNQHYLSIFILVVFIALISGILYFMIVTVAREAVSFMADLPAMYGQFLDSTKHISEYLVSVNLFPDALQWNMDQIMESLKSVLLTAVNRIGSTGASHMGVIATNVVNFLIGIIVSILSAYFFIVYKDKMFQTYRKKCSKELQSRLDDIFYHIKNALGGYVIAQLKLMGIIFVILSIGLFLSGNPYALFVAFMIAIVDIIPF